MRPDTDEILADMRMNDLFSRACYYAVIFERLMEFPRFMEFVQANYVIEQHIDQTIGGFHIRVVEIGENETSEEVHSKLRREARAVQKELKKRADEAASRKDGEEEGQQQ